MNKLVSEGTLSSNHFEKIESKWTKKLHSTEKAGFQELNSSNNVLSLDLYDTTEHSNCVLHIIVSDGTDSEKLCIMCSNSGNNIGKDIVRYSISGNYLGLDFSFNIVENILKCVISERNVSKVLTSKYYKILSAL